MLGLISRLSPLSCALKPIYAGRASDGLCLMGGENGQVQARLTYDDGSCPRSGGLMIGDLIDVGIPLIFHRILISGCVFYDASTERENLKK